MANWFWGYGAALLVVAVLDGLWLGFIAIDFYKRELGDLMTDNVRLLPAAVFYFGYPAGLVALTIAPLSSFPGSVLVAAGKAALFGLVVYGVYDMTNMATLRHWSLKLALVDMAWGTLVTAAAGAAAFAAVRWAVAR